MTPQQIEAMKLALEALEIEEAQTHYPSQFLLRAITAIKEALAEHAMQEVQRLGQEIEPDDIASILACREMLDAQPVPPQRKPLSDDECDAIYAALNAWARDVDEYDFGLPAIAGGGMEAARAIIREATA